MATYGTRSEQDRLGKRDVNRSRSSRRSEGESLVVVNVGRNLLRLYWAGLLNSTVCAGGFFFLRGRISQGVRGATCCARNTRKISKCGTIPGKFGCVCVCRSGCCDKGYYPSLNTEEKIFETGRSVRGRASMKMGLDFNGMAVTLKWARRII